MIEGKYLVTRASQVERDTDVLTFAL